MLFSFILAQIDTVKRFAEMWRHRLQGHMTVTITTELGNTFHYFATDLFSDDGELWADLTTGDSIPLLAEDDITITGA